MLVTLLAWIFITFLCWTWGGLLLEWLKIIFRDNTFILPHFSIICLAGFAAITVIAGILSLLMPLGGWQALLLISSPCLLLFFRKGNRGFYSRLKNQFTDLHPVVLFLLLASLVLILLMSTWKINHPDTLAYHAQTIQWIEKYRVIPGLVHLYTRYGYQGQWFVSCAFFSFRFTGTEALTFINSTVITWYFLFIVQKINAYHKDRGSKINSILWLLLFAGSCLSYTQVRLTVTSANPDFIATIVIWTVFYLFLKERDGRSTVHWLLIVILSIFSITLKVSAIPIFILSAYSIIQLFRLKKIKASVIACFLALLIMSPFLTRNIITTGYLVFPSVFPDIVLVDWKYDNYRTKLEKDYITAYARTHANYTKEEIEKTIAMPAGRWLPLWWQNNSVADKVILLVLALSFITAIARLKAIIRSPLHVKMALITAMSGIAFWFIQAPDPRFGFGFIIAFIAVVFALFLPQFKLSVSIYKKAIIASILASALAVSGYIGYRFFHFFSDKQLITPIGIENTSSTSFECNHFLFCKPTTGEFCGDLSIPCIYSDSCNFLLRGEKITDGFRAKTKE